MNGKSAYTKILGIAYSSVNSTDELWRAYPNPTNGQTLRLGYLKDNLDLNETIQLRITHLYSTRVLESPSLSDLNSKLAEIQNSLPKGLLIFEIYWSDQVSRIKVLN